jgi:class 3 adenylate cyclase
VRRRPRARRASAFGAELGIVIGVNTGRVLAGTVGGGGKLEFAVIGDAVNVAARVEGRCNETDIFDGAGVGWSVHR